MNRQIVKNLLESISSVIIGQEETIQKLLACTLAEGHALLEGPPGVGKTTLAKVLSICLGGAFRRIQMTPDLLPSDIIGSSYFDVKEGVFKIRQGPIFANVLLIDELNRASPRTQSALLEAMQERQATIEGNTFSLPRPFIIIATQGPSAIAGTFPLTEVQLDRFAMKLISGIPSREIEKKIVANIDEIEQLKIKPVLTLSDAIRLIDEAKGIKISERILDYILNIIEQIRNDKRIRLPPSPRASIWLYKIGRVFAYLDGRNYMIPDDVKRIAHEVLRHRIYLKTEWELEGIEPDTIIRETLESVAVPRE